LTKGVATTIKNPNIMKVQILTRAFHLVLKTDFLCKCAIQTNKDYALKMFYILGAKSRYSSMNGKKNDTRFLSGIVSFSLKDVTSFAKAKSKV